jgi:hypothetical protein
MTYIIFSMGGALIFSTAYGFEVLPESEPYINRAVNALRTLSDAATPGKYLVVSSTRFRMDPLPLIL